MLERTGDLWDAWAAGHWIALTTNGMVTRAGRCVMGRGVAKQAADRMPDLPSVLGGMILKEGNHVHAFPEYRVWSFPVKHHWRELANMTLIVRSARELKSLVPGWLSQVYIVRPGCGNGGLNWKHVKPRIEDILDDRFIVINKEAE